MFTKAFVIEFLGLPGSGKSTLSHRVAQMLREIGVPVEEPTYTLTHMPSPWIRLFKKGLRVGWGALCMPRCASILTRAVISSHPESAAVMLVNLLFVATLVRKPRRGPTIAILDQGVFQAVWSIGFRGDERAITRCVAALVGCDLLPSAVVAMDVPVDVVRNRLSQRSGAASALEKTGIDDASWQRAASVYEQIKEALYGLVSQGEPLHILRISNAHGDIETNARQVASEICTICNFKCVTEEE